MWRWVSDGRRWRACALGRGKDHIAAGLCLFRGWQRHWEPAQFPLLAQSGRHTLCHPACQTVVLSGWLQKVWCLQASQQKVRLFLFSSFTHNRILNVCRITTTRLQAFTKILLYYFIFFLRGISIFLKCLA